MVPPRRDERVISNVAFWPLTEKGQADLDACCWQETGRGPRSPGLPPLTLSRPLLGAVRLQ